MKPINIKSFQILATIYGFCNGAFHTGSNPLLLRLWAGRDASPSMYAMHASFGGGALLAPILAKPFLREPVTSVTTAVANLTNNASNLTSTASLPDQHHFWSICTLYPLVAACLLLLVPAFLWLALEERQAERRGREREAGAAGVVRPEPGLQATRCQAGLLIACMAAFYFTFAGLENSFRNFTPAYARFCSLQLSRQQAADVLAVFYLAFATTRLLVIPLSSLNISPGILLWSSTTLVTAATALLAVSASRPLLDTSVALAGAGLASMFASGMLWVKSFIPVTNRVGGLFIVFASVASQASSMLIGSQISHQPATFPRLMLGLTAGLLASFAAANIVGGNIKKAADSTAETLQVVESGGAGKVESSGYLARLQQSGLAEQLKTARLI